MKKNNEREPDLIQYRLEYCLNDDLPSERFFMATDPRDALSQLAYSCIKYIPVDSLNEEEQDSFAKAFANPTKPLVQAPDLLPVPEPIPDIDSLNQKEHSATRKKRRAKRHGDEIQKKVLYVSRRPIPTKNDPATEHKQNKMNGFQISEIEKGINYSKKIWKAK